MHFQREQLPKHRIEKYSFKENISQSDNVCACHNSSTVAVNNNDNSGLEIIND